MAGPAITGLGSFSEGFESGTRIGNNIASAALTQTQNETAKMAQFDKMRAQAELLKPGPDYTLDEQFQKAPDEIKKFYHQQYKLFGYDINDPNRTTEQFRTAHTAMAASRNFDTSMRNKIVDVSRVEYADAFKKKQNELAKGELADKGKIEEYDKIMANAKKTQTIYDDKKEQKMLMFHQKAMEDTEKNKRAAQLNNLEKYNEITWDEDAYKFVPKEVANELYRGGEPGKLTEQWHYRNLAVQKFYQKNGRMPQANNEADQFELGNTIQGLMESTRSASAKERTDNPAAKHIETKTMYFRDKKTGELSQETVDPNLKTEDYDTYNARVARSMRKWEKDYDVQLKPFSKTKGDGLKIKITPKAVYGQQPGK